MDVTETLRRFGLDYVLFGHFALSQSAVYPICVSLFRDRRLFVLKN